MAIGIWMFFREKLTPVRSQMMAIPHERMPQSVMCETQYGYIQFRDSIQNEQVYRLLTGCDGQHHIWK